MPTWKGIIAKSFSPEEFEVYIHTLKFGSWKPKLIVLHNTAIPSLADRPMGFTIEHMKSFEHYYRDNQKWGAGPHLFIDDRAIWVFSPLTGSGVHSPSWNSISLGIEMLGDYSKESFTDGRGLNVHRNAVAAMASLCSLIGLDPLVAIKLHKEDPKTTHACPGVNVVKSVIVQEVADLVLPRKL